MTELSQNQVERRFQIASSNPVPVNIAALPGLFFRPLSGGEKGISSRTYSKALMGYIKDGMLSKCMVPDVLRASVEAAGMSMKVLVRKGDLYRKQMAALPEDLMGPYDQLTPDEVAELPAEKQVERSAAIEERGKRIVELLAGALTDEERQILGQINRIEALEQELMEQTAERAAQQETYVCEILMGARTEDGKPYFTGAEDLAAIEPQAALVNLLVAWNQFREGQPSDFFSRS
jgi:hypothetical protein